MTKRRRALGPVPTAALFLLVVLTTPQVVSSLAAPNSRATTQQNNKDDNTSNMKRRILCLHGGSQSGAILSNKIGGARRKLQRVYDLHFIDGPILVSSRSTSATSEEDESDATPTATTISKTNEESPPPPQLLYSWLDRDEQGNICHLDEAIAHVRRETQGQSYDAVIGFSQGGTLATALAMAGILPGKIQAVVTAGAPYIGEQIIQAALAAAAADKNNNTNSHDKNYNHSLLEQQQIVGLSIPKLHMAGSMDIMVPVESTRMLCDTSGNGELVIHDQGHLFPTRAGSVNYMMEFLQRALQ
jgi:pimeloyl-ACP methyl ester carboxylesterase